MQDSIKRLTDFIVAFRKEREWQQFHTPKDMALSLTLEATEVLEHFQWKNEAAALEHVKTHKNDIAEELADVFFWTLMMSHDFGIDLEKALDDKMKKNALRYPVEKAKGNAKKYTELQKES
jgi:NTP pyrophosphatase (non-canonical NTP hydrolase)